jgi:AraC-like DNA-binding protein
MPKGDDCRAFELPVLNRLLPHSIERFLLATRAEALMSENLSVQVSLGKVAEECGLSVRHLAPAFRQSTGSLAASGTRVISLARSRRRFA